MNIAIILEQLQKVEEALKCSVCLKKCTNPVKLKVCGHYFCFKCFKIKNRLCPMCKAYCEESEIDYNNIAKQCNNLLLELKHLLEPDQKCSGNNSKNISVKHNIIHSIDIFVYNNKMYHINYVDNIRSKLNAKGESTLHIACKKNKLDEVIALINKKTDLNAKDFAGWAPLHEAVESDSVEIVETLLKNGALIDIPGEKYITPLHKAVDRGNINLIKILLKQNPNKEVIDYSGRKPIDCTLNEDIKSIFAESIDYICRTEELFCGNKINAYLYYIEEQYKQKLIESKLVSVIKEYDVNKVTHFFIRKSHKLSVKIMVAMLDGCFLLPQEWIDDFLKNSYFIAIPEFTFISNPELNNGIRKAILNSLIKLPKLFDGLYFFIQGHNTSVEIRNMKLTKESIRLLITSGGGKILHRAPTPSTCENIFNYPYHANVDGKTSRCCHYLIYEEDRPPTLQYQMEEIKHRTSKWLIDCVINFSICD